MNEIQNTVVDCAERAVVTPDAAHWRQARLLAGQLAAGGRAADGGGAAHRSPSESRSPASCSSWVAMSWRWHAGIAEASISGTKSRQEPVLVVGESREACRLMVWGKVRNACMPGRGLHPAACPGLCGACEEGA